MQFLVYLTVLMVSISTVLLEVHWLTSPPPQPKPTAQATSALAPIRKVEGPNAAISPVYPKPLETPGPAEASNPAQSQTSASTMSTRGAPETKGEAAPVQQQPSMTPTTAAPVQQPAAETTANAAPLQRTLVETTGVATREQDSSQAATGGTNAPNRVNNPQESAAGPLPSNNRCDVQACSSAYRSFRASDCTYQPFEGARRFCEKPLVQRTAREQREEPERRRWSRDAETRIIERRARDFDDDDDDGPEFDDSARGFPGLFLFGRRSRW